jgi:hypothetical protein
MSADVQPIHSPGVEAMRQHLDHLFGGYLDGCQDGLIELAWTDTKPDDKGKYKLGNALLFGTHQIEELVEEAVRRNSIPMCNVYIGAALRHPHTAPFGRTKDSEAYALTCGYVDLDDAGATAAARRVYEHKAKPTMVVVTGREPHVRAQMWWRLDEPLTEPARWPALLRGMAKAMGGDPSVTNPARVMRLAGTIAWPVKEGRNAIELTAIAPLNTPGAPVYNVRHLASVFPPLAAGDHSVNSSDADERHTNALGTKLTDGRERYMLQTIGACLIECIGEHGSSPTAQELFDAAWPQYERKVDLTRPGRGKQEFAEKCAYTVSRFERGEIRGIETLDLAVANYKQKQVAREAAPITELPASLQPEIKPDGVTATAFQWVDPANIPPREWVYGRHYIRRFVSTTVAPGGVGKSSLTIGEALAICTGRALLGVQVDERANVWLWNGEDPQDELDRRVMATALHHGLIEDDVKGKLFVDNGRQTPIIIAERTRDGVTINAPLVDQVIATIKANGIGVMVIDPFIACHRVTENDNNEIDRVAKIWAGIADVTACSIELVHHVRKANGTTEVAVEDGRGAGALLAAARAARALNRMTKEEGERAGIADHRFYFRADDGKSNMAPPSAEAKWFQMLPFDLQNETAKRPSDKVGVVSSWEWPNPLDDVTAGDVDAAIRAAASGNWRADSQANGWFGVAIMDIMGLPDTLASRAQAKALQAIWVKNEALQIVKEKDEKRMERTFIRPGSKVATPP